MLMLVLCCYECVWYVLRVCAYILCRLEKSVVAHGRGEECCSTWATLAVLQLLSSLLSLLCPFLLFPFLFSFLESCALRDSIITSVEHNQYEISTGAVKLAALLLVIITYYIISILLFYILYIKSLYNPIIICCTFFQQVQNSNSRLSKWHFLSH